jgi:hypothetical protein
VRFLLFLGVVIGACYFAYQNFLGADAGIDPLADPVYGRMTVTQTIGSREVEGIVLVKTYSQEDCQTRGRSAIDKMMVSCKDCATAELQCLDALPKRETGYFDKEPTHLSYLLAEPGMRDERAGAVIIWGLTTAEGREACDFLKNKLTQRYSGTVTCVRDHDA